ncbi:hypothetical protein J5O04_03095 [Corynebacterium hindlerae]|uniref:hypothetical protein n=1 Tax=Corynebacterium hindlerae TaxID=699041 RepID=UPI001AD7190A|nr:hypothetical protein [Corynebacterium hindlerae]QTH60135.1 hypothetical protein J5O04_03095 [Corynebacterium hindlerae]
MSDKQLTVAELMARAAAEGRSSTPRRRRRRSLEDGGVSVAELTGSLPKVAAKPEQPRHTSEPIDDPKPAPAPKAPVVTPLTDAPQPEPVPETEPVVHVIHEDDPIKLTTDSFPAQTADKVEEAAPEARAEEAPVEAPIETPAELPVEPPVEPPVEQTATMAPVATDWETEPTEESGVVDTVEDEDEGRVSILSVVLMAIVGVALGAAIFFGFRELWANVNTLLVGALAGVMTLGLVGVVHALRTERDTLSMTLAAVTGLALTFGPLLIVGL